MMSQYLLMVFCMTSWSLFGMFSPSERTRRQSAFVASVRATSKIDPSYRTPFPSLPESVVLDSENKDVKERAGSGGSSVTVSPEAGELREEPPFEAAEEMVFLPERITFPSDGIFTSLQHLNDYVKQNPGYCGRGSFRTKTGLIMSYRVNKWGISVFA